MQLNLLKPEHTEFLEKEFGITEVQFKKMCEDDSEELENLLEELLWKECDAADELEKTGEYTPEGLCAMELIDIVCGPYDEEEINASIAAAG